jgi:NAD(P)-dependent dehydrogenase (short-subunit alcohol dehydrogenase family)
MDVGKRLKAALNVFMNGIGTKEFQNESQAPARSPSAEDHLLSGKNVFITGAGRNVGRGIALEMAKQGANIFFTDIDEARNKKLKHELNRYPVQSRGYVSDISKNADIDSIYNLLAQSKIKVDVLVNNVGIQLETKSLKDLDLAEWHNTYNTNVFGPMYLTKKVSQMMVQHQIQGCIIYITSIHQDILVRWPSYSSSKAALGMVIKELALDLAPYGIRVNGIAPGGVREDEQGNPYPHRNTPLYQSSINPCYIGRAAVYLASDYFSKFTTGTVIKIDAGLSLYNYRVADEPPS